MILKLTFLSVLMPLAILAATLAPLSSLGLAGSEPSPVFAESCGGGSNAIVLKLNSGNIDAINSQHGTATLRQFPGQPIYVISAPNGASVDSLVSNLRGNSKVEWAEAGQYSQGGMQASQFSGASLDQFAQSVLDQFSTAALDEFSEEALDEFSEAALNQFSTAALDQFSTAVLDQFSTAVLDQFSTTILDQFGQAALDQFSTAMLDQFSTAALDEFSEEALDEFSAAILDQFSAATLDQFSTAILDQFTAAALDQFSTAALDQFSTAIMDQFSTAIMDQFTQATLDQFSAAALDQFSASILDQFSAAILDEFTVDNLNQFTQSALDGYAASIMNQFSTAVLDQFTAASLDQFTAASLDQFTMSAFDQFTQSILDSFDADYFHELLLDTLDSVYGARARGQAAMVNTGVPQAHEYATGDDVVVAVIDTGIIDHWYLRDRIAPGGYDFVDGDFDPTDVANGIDEDGDGLVDEGWSHGTHVAGIVSLVAPDAEILPIRVQDSDGGGWSFLMAEAIQYAVDQGAHVINISLEVPCFSRIVDWAVNYAVTKGVAVVASVGNVNLNSVKYPARSPGSIAVAAVDNNDVKASYSNYGVEVDVSAPGLDIYSAYGKGVFAWWSGTSQASPIVAGQAALVIESNPMIRSIGIRRAIVDTAADISGQNPGYTGMLGSGRVDTLAAVTSSMPQGARPMLLDAHAQIADLLTRLTDSGTLDKAVKVRNGIDATLTYFTTDSAVNSIGAYNMLGGQVIVGLKDIATMIADGKDDESNVHNLRVAALLVQEAARKLSDAALSDAIASNAPTDIIDQAKDRIEWGDEDAVTTDIGLLGKGLIWYASKKAIQHYKDSWLKSTK